MGKTVNDKYTKDKNGSYIGWSGYSGSALEGDGTTVRIKRRLFSGCK